MTHRYAHRRVASLLRLVQTETGTRVLDWPQAGGAEKRLRTNLATRPARVAESPERPATLLG